MKKQISLLFVFLSFFTLNAQNGLNFDGVDDYVQTTAPSVSGTNARTIEAWIKTTKNYNPSIGGLQGVILDMGTFNLGQRFTFNILWSNSIRIEIGGTGISGTTAINDGNWHHVAVVYDPSQTTQVYLYIDGQLETSGNFGGSMNFNTGSGNMVIGRRIDNVNYFEGTIDEVRVWNVARTATEIANTMNSEFCTPPSGMAAYYKMNQGVAGSSNSGLTTLPEFVSGNDGTLNNFALNGSTSNWVTGYGLTSGSSQGSITVTECFAYSSPSGNTYTTSGNYTDTITTAFGCDSIISINLTINSIDTNLIVNNQTITAVQNGSSYQWLDCDNNYAIIPGQTGQSITISNNGSYAVQVVSNGCLDTTGCVTIGGIGIQETHSHSLQLYPNPTQNHLVIKGLEGAYSYSIHDLSGRIVLRGESNHDQRIDLQNLTDGTYFIQINRADLLRTMKFIVR
jgi:hypothetical protein